MREQLLSDFLSVRNSGGSLFIAAAADAAKHKTSGVRLGGSSGDSIFNWGVPGTVYLIDKKLVSANLQTWHALQEL